MTTDELKHLANDVIDALHPDDMYTTLARALLICLDILDDIRTAEASHPIDYPDFFYRWRRRIHTALETL